MDISIFLVFDKNEECEMQVLTTNNEMSASIEQGNTRKVTIKFLFFMLCMNFKRFFMFSMVQIIVLPWSIVNNIRKTVF